MMDKSQFRKIDPYDWFCAPGTHIGLKISSFHHNTGNNSHKKKIHFIHNTDLKNTKNRDHYIIDELLSLKYFNVKSKFPPYFFIYQKQKPINIYLWKIQNKNHKNT